jgi:hypothetical protein
VRVCGVVSHNTGGTPGGTVYMYNPRLYSLLHVPPPTRCRYPDDFLSAHLLQPATAPRSPTSHTNPSTTILPATRSAAAPTTKAQARRKSQTMSAKPMACVRTMSRLMARTRVFRCGGDRGVRIRRGRVGVFRGYL